MGIRRPSVLRLILLFAALLLMSRVTAVWQFVALQILAGGVGSFQPRPLRVPADS